MKVFLGGSDEKLGEVMRRYRNEHNYTQKKIADYLGLDRTTYSNYETAQRKPELDVIMKLVALYNVSVDEFLNGFFEEKSDKVTPLAAASAPSSNKSEEIFSLTDDEKQLLLFYRDCVHKKEVFEKAREVWLRDADIKPSEN